MKHYRLKSIRKGEDIIYLTLEPKRSRDRLQFYAGQYATIGFKGMNGRRSPMRCFSIVSTPASGELQFAMRLGGNFTQTVGELQAGTEMYVQGPFGNFVTDQRYDRNIVMLAGGIGITPFMSMIRTASLDSFPIPMTLLYSYRSGHNIPFYEELKQLAAQNARFNIISFVTDKAFIPNEPRMLSGKISEDHIKQVTSGKFAGSTYFVCGPKGFMDHTTSLLQDHGVSESRIITESFTQSSKVLTGQGFSVQKLTYVFASAVLLFGIGSIALLDLSRYVPRYTKAASLVRSSAGSSSGASQAASSGSNSSGGSSSSSSSSSSANNSSNTSSGYNNYYQQPVQTYQAPVTSVS